MAELIGKVRSGELAGDELIDAVVELTPDDARIYALRGDAARGVRSSEQAKASSSVNVFFSGSGPAGAGPPEVVWLMRVAGRDLR